VHHSTNHLAITNKCDHVLEFIIQTFLNCSTCFERHSPHHQELKNCNCSLWIYIRLWLPAAVIAEWERSSHSAMTAADNHRRM